MLADEIGLHKWDAFQLIVVDGLDECELWWAKESLVRKFYLVLEVGQCMNIVGCMVDSLIGK